MTMVNSETDIKKNFLKKFYRSQYDMYITGNMSNLRVDTCLFLLQFKQSVN